MAHTSLGADVMRKFAEALPEATADKAPALEGRTMTMLFTPVANK